MITRTKENCDIILISGEYWDDHPLSPVGVIARVLDDVGYQVGIIERPETDEDFTKLGKPKLFFGVTSGSVDSMVHNYTPMKRLRKDDPYANVHPMPDRAVIVYCNAIKRLLKGVPIVIGGVESSLRRFAHYDYWDNKIRRSILLDSRADILVYGNGEKQVLEIASRLKDGKDLVGIEGTCVLSREMDDSFRVLPSFSEVTEDPESFADMQAAFSINENLAQEYNNNYVLQFAYPEYSSSDLDWIFGLNFSRKMHKNSLLKGMKYSVVTHRGCIGTCSFCSISMHQGNRVISRSEKSILKEIESISHIRGFRGYIDDMGGPSANMYGMDCSECSKGECIRCERLEQSHERLISLMKKARAIHGIKKIYVRSGIRHDLAVDSPEYVKELVAHHISGTLKVAPEHFSGKVLRLMGKYNNKFEDFIAMYNEESRGRKQALRLYLMIGHPGETMETVSDLAARIRKMKNIENFQFFTPTPMTVSTCMYWTSMHPETKEKVKVVHDYNTKKRMKRKILSVIGH